MNMISEQIWGKNKTNISYSCVLLNSLGRINCQPIKWGLWNRVMLHNFCMVLSFTCSVFAVIKHYSLCWPGMKGRTADVSPLLMTSAAHLPSCLFPLCVQPWAFLQFTRRACGQPTNVGAGSREAARTQISGAEQRGCWITVRMIPLQRPLTSPDRQRCGRLQILQTSNKKKKKSVRLEVEAK